MGQDTGVLCPLTPPINPWLHFFLASAARWSTRTDKPAQVEARRRKQQPVGTKRAGRRRTCRRGGRRQRSTKSDRGRRAVALDPGRGVKLEETGLRGLASYTKILLSSGRT
eukprot:scaffold37_cov346-Pavlova_lutheri.AAC.16